MNTKNNENSALGLFHWCADRMFEGRLERNRTTHLPKCVGGMYMVSYLKTFGEKSPERKLQKKTTGGCNNHSLLVYRRVKHFLSFHESSSPRRQPVGPQPGPSQKKIPTPFKKKQQKQ